MTSLDDLRLKTSYHKGTDDIANDFYLPCMHRATHLDRAVGFFRSAVFVVAWPALRDFVSRGGMINVLCSQVLAGEDIAALEDGYAAHTDALLAVQFREEVRSLLSDPNMGAPARVLAALVAERKLEFQIAVFSKEGRSAAPGRIFHDKLGIFRDRAGNRVIFKGSMNETWSGLAADGNLESVDVAASWLGGRDLERVEAEEQYFQQLWTRTYPGLLVRPFPEVARQELVQAAATSWEQSLSDILTEAKTAKADPKGRSLRPHQSAGLAAWAAQGRRGILAFATGAGKTFTALQAIRDALTVHREPVLIVVPDQTLFSQWHAEVLASLADLGVEALKAGAGNSDWRPHLRNWLSTQNGKRVVIATVQTASAVDFRNSLPLQGNTLLVADEVHRLGSRHHRTLLIDRAFGPRLGLSATPERFGDPEGTFALTGFFRGVLEPRYSLADAIRDKVLTPYIYRPHPVRLSEIESNTWKRLTAEAARLRARIASGDDASGLQARLQIKLIERSRIVKHAAAKVPLASEVIGSEYRVGDRWLIYCDDLIQLEAVTGALSSEGHTVLPFHSAMAGDREGTLRWLERRGGIVTAIKCLDEGVDIPAVSHALILASSKNPREFVQRRGRVLRLAPKKPLAYIHDAIVLPPITEDEESRGDPVTAGELGRAIEFAEHADNPSSNADLKLIALSAGLRPRELAVLGIEDEDNGIG